MKQRQPFHSIAPSFTARDGDGEILVKRMHFLIGGGLVVDEEEAGRHSRGYADAVSLPYPFTPRAAMSSMGPASAHSFAQMMRQHETQTIATTERATRHK